MIRSTFFSTFLLALVISLELLFGPTQPVSAGLGGGEPVGWPANWSLWPGGIVPVFISESFNVIDENGNNEKETIRQGLNTWRDRTGYAVQFNEIEPPPWPERYVHILTPKEFVDETGETEPTGCNSWGPQTTGPTYTYLTAPDCINLPSIIHEVGHAIGLGHEQLRPDRDFYIQFEDWQGDNEPDPWPESIEEAPVGFFDYYSFMHTRTEHATPLAPDIIWPLPWVPLGGPSDGDIDTVRALYAFDIGYDQDIFGGDYAHLILANNALHRDCMLACAADVRCHAYTYVGLGVLDNTPHCYLKDDGSIPFSSYTGMHSGVRKSDQNCSFGVALDVDLVGGQISDGVVSMPHNLLNGNNCKDLCAQDPRCDAFTFVPGEVNGTCYKKSHNPDPPEPLFTYQQRDGYMSGVVRGANDPLNLAPTSDAGGPYTQVWAGPTTTLTLDGTASSDPEGSSLAYFWTTDCPGGPEGPIDDSRSPQPTLTVSTSASCCSTCNVSLIVTDDQCFRSSRDSATVTIQDTTPPALIGVPADQTIECDATVPPPAVVTATDNCDTSVVPTFAETRVDGSCEGNYTLMRTWTGVDDCGNSTSATQIITVQDTRGPHIFCNAPAFLTPPQAPISFTSTATDNCSGATTQITGYDCVGKKGKSKLESCVVTFSGSTITILDSGGVGDTISWTVQANDSCENSTNKTCDISVVKPKPSMH